MPEFELDEGIGKALVVLGEQYDGGKLRKMLVVTEDADGYVHCAWVNFNYLEKLGLVQFLGGDLVNNTEYDRHEQSEEGAE